MKEKPASVTLATGTFTPAQVAQMAAEADAIIARAVLDPRNVAHITEVMIGQAKNGDAQARRDWMAHVAEYRELSQPPAPAKPPVNVNVNQTVKVEGKRPRRVKVATDTPTVVARTLAENGPMTPAALADRCNLPPDGMKALSEAKVVKVVRGKVTLGAKGKQLVGA